MNLTCSEKIEKVFEKYFQKTISLCIKDEVLKKGKFLLIRNQVIGNNYYYDIVIEKSKKLDTVKIPYPFNLEEYETDNIIFLDYRLSSLFNNIDYKQDLEKWIKNSDIKNTNKFFHNILEIRFE
jgi:hypothetical protein